MRQLIFLITILAAMLPATAAACGEPDTVQFPAQVHVGDTFEIRIRHVGGRPSPEDTVLWARYGDQKHMYKFVDGNSYRIAKIWTSNEIGRAHV